VFGVLGKPTCFVFLHVCTILHAAVKQPDKIAGFAIEGEVEKREALARDRRPTDTLLLARHPFDPAAHRSQAPSTASPTEMFRKF